MLTETHNTRPGYGQDRLIIRGRSYLALTLARQTRPRYNDYPERYPVNPDFPAPGRRGPSRPPKDVIAVRPAPTTGGGTFPANRDRTLQIQPGLNTNVPGVGTGYGGISINRGVDVANGVTAISVIGPIGRPMVIRYVEVWGGGSDAARSNIGVRVSSDNVTTGGFDTAGVPLGIDISGDVDFSGHGQMHRTWPNFVWNSTPSFIKFIVFNNSGAAQFYHLVIGLDWLQ